MPNSVSSPNILMIMVDQMRFPRYSFGAEHGFADPIKQILGFQGSNHEANEYKRFFPGFWALRENAVVLNNHRIASSACVPSRTALFTGQYGTITGVTQTDGLFKDGTDSRFKWLEEKTYPTIGSWMRAAGYSSHYFGKWHMSGESTTNLEGFGFSNWELSAPDPHGTLPNNLGHYRDHQFIDNVCGFLKRQGLGIPYSIQHAEANTAESELMENYLEPSKKDAPQPWFAVASFTNPHDIAAYPGLPRTVYDATLEGARYTLAVPPKGAKSSVDYGGTMQLTLNKLGLPQNSAEVAPHWNEDLLNNNKPDCQFDYKYKMGMSLVCKSGRLAAEKVYKGNKASWDKRMDFAVNFAMDTNITGLPFARTDNPELASRAFMQYYAYLFSEVDQHIYRTLQTLEETGQADNTIVIFCPDHGEYGASHGTLMEKWHSAYEEVIHVPFVIKFPTSLRSVKNGLEQIDDITSHIDVLPTILGLIKAHDGNLTKLSKKLKRHSYKHYDVKPAGDDLSARIMGEETTIRDASGKKRKSVLFMTHDTITEPLFGEREDNQKLIHAETLEYEQQKKELTNFGVFNQMVRSLREEGKEENSEVQFLKPGPVAHPNNVHAVVDNSGWKLVRYFNKNQKLTAGHVEQLSEAQYELYDLNTDPNEEKNLLVYNKEFPTVIKLCKNKDKVKRKARSLMKKLKSHEANQLGEVFVNEI